MKKFHLTKEGYQELVEELKTLKEVKRPHLVGRVANARAFGDLTENSEYQSAREELSFIEGRIEELELVLAKSALITNTTKGVIGLGSQVTVVGNGKSLTYHIVGEWEADPLKQKISAQSPLGKALLGKKIGEQVEINAPVGKIIYTIQKIH